MLTLMPVQTDDEKEMVSRTVYCTNIDKKVCESISLVACVANCVTEHLKGDLIRIHIIKFVLLVCKS
jgi:hypothetical protein